MLDQSVLARCNLFGVLGSLDHLVASDPDCRQWLPQKRLGIRFSVHGGPSTVLSLDSTSASMSERAPAGVVLGFTSPEHCNRMVAGKANPIPLWGLHHLPYLSGPFGKLTKRLEYFLRPGPEVLSAPLKFTLAAELTLYTAMSALVQIANHDPRGQQSARRIPDGVLQIVVQDSIAVRLAVRGGVLSLERRLDPDPRAVLAFASLKDAYAILSGSLDTYTALASGALAMRGFIPMIENLNPILDLVGEYLA